MTLVIGSTGRYTHRHLQRHPALRRLSVLLRFWQRRPARRRFERRVLAETQDPELLLDIGIRAQRPSHVERWITAMLWHQH